jgi:hypothetical protein
MLGVVPAGFGRTGRKGALRVMDRDGLEPVATEGRALWV